MEKFYTLQVALHRKQEGTDLSETHEFRDLTSDRLATLSKTVWTTGVWIKQAPQSWEIISPFAIKQAFVILQDRRFNPINEPEEKL